MIHNRNPAGSLRLLLRAMGAWGLSALLLLPLAALLLSKLPIGSAALGYWSSSLSFLTAFFAGLTAGDRRREGSLSVCMLAGLLLNIALLTLGILTGAGLDPSGILSVVSFTFAGVLLGGVVASRVKGSGKRRGSISGFRLRRK